MTIQCLAHVGICGSDLERSQKFYRDALSFKEVARLMAAGEPSATLLDLEEVDLCATFLERDGVRIEPLWYVQPGGQAGPVPRSMNQFRLTHVPIRVDDLEQTLAALRHDGVAILDDTRIPNSKLGAEAVYVHDPDGLRLELIETPGDPSAPLGEPLG